MGVQVDEPGRDDQAGGVELTRRGAAHATELARRSRRGSRRRRGTRGFSAPSTIMPLRMSTSKSATGTSASKMNVPSALWTESRGRRSRRCSPTSREEHAELPAVIDGDTTLTFPELRAESLRVAGGLHRLGVRPGRSRRGVGAERVAVGRDRVRDLGARRDHRADRHALPRHRSGVDAAPHRAPRPRRRARPLGRRPAGAARARDRRPRGDGRRFRDLAEHRARGGRRRRRRHGRRPSTRASGRSPTCSPLGDDVDPDELAALTGGVDPDAPCEILFTSGTTGTPKAVLLGQWQMLRAHWTWAGIAGLRAGDRFLIVSPYAHGAGIHVGLMGCMSRGVANVPVARFDPVDGAALVERHRVTALLGPPALYQYLLEAVDQGRDLSSLRVGIVGTASVPTALIERIRDGLELERIVNAYGLTEGGVVAMTRDDDSVEVMSTTSGRALPDVEIRTVDDDGNDTPLGEPGEIVVAQLRDRARLLGPARARGRVDRRRRLVPHRRHRHARRRGQRVDRRPQGRHVHRRRLQRLPRGDREPAARAIRRSRRCRWSACPTSDSARWASRSSCGEPVRLAGRRPTTSSPGRATRWPTTRCRARSLMVDALPLNANGKVDKRNLRDRYVRATTAR